MKESRGRLTTLSTLLVGLMAAWTGYRISVFVPAFSQLFAGLGTELPYATRVFVAIPSITFLVVGLTAGALVIVKDYFLARERTRLQVNLLVAILSLFLYMFYHSAMLQPMVEMVRKIG